MQNCDRDCMFTVVVAKLTLKKWFETLYNGVQIETLKHKKYTLNCKDGDF